MIDLGKVRPGSTIRIPFGSFAASTGAPSAVTNYADADIQVYKDGSTTQRASAAGLTATTTFDTLTGVNLITIDLADNTTADFWAAGSEYIVVISDITVDSQTLRFPIARFTIGIPGELFATTVATLASQTSFTLTAGPAEDDALNGCVLYLHDAASAVQCGFAVVQDYTGSTKTVALAAGTTFTLAAKDNVHVMTPRLLPTTAGRQLNVDASNRALADTVALSGDATAADNAEAFFDGTGYAGTNNVIPTVTNLTNLPAAAALEATLTAMKGATFNGATDSLEALRDRGDAAWATATGFATSAALTTVEGKVDTVDTVVDTILGQTGTTGVKIAADALDAASLATTAVDEIAAAIGALTVTELASIPAASPTLKQAIALVYMALRNKRDTDSTGGTDEIHNDAGTVIGTAAVTDSGTLFSKGKYA